MQTFTAGSLKLLVIKTIDSQHSLATLILLLVMVLTAIQKGVGSDDGRDPLL